MSKPDKPSAWAMRAARRIGVQFSRKGVEAAAAIIDEESPNARLLAALEKLENAERYYRVVHDLEGDGHLETGMAWDRLRKAGDEARAAIKAASE